MSFAGFDVHEKFGGKESFSLWKTLPRRALYLLAADSTPKACRQTRLEFVVGNLGEALPVGGLIASNPVLRQRLR